MGMPLRKVEDSRTDDRIKGGCMKRDGSPIAYLKAVNVCLGSYTFGEVAAILDGNLIWVDSKNRVVLLKEIHGISSLTTAHIQDFHVLGKSTFEELVEQVVIHIA
jgi:hypothetical protein